MTGSVTVWSSLGSYLSLVPQWEPTLYVRGYTAASGDPAFCPLVDSPMGSTGVGGRGGGSGHLCLSAGGQAPLKVALPPLEPWALGWSQLHCHQRVWSPCIFSQSVSSELSGKLYLLPAGIPMDGTGRKDGVGFVPETHFRMCAPGLPVLFMMGWGRKQAQPIC